MFIFATSSFSFEPMFTRDSSPIVRESLLYSSPPSRRQETLFDLAYPLAEGSEDPPPTPLPAFVSAFPTDPSLRLNRLVFSPRFFFWNFSHIVCGPLNGAAVLHDSSLASSGGRSLHYLTVVLWATLHPHP